MENKIDWESLLVGIVFTLIGAGMVTAGILMMGIQEWGGIAVFACGLLSAIKGIAWIWAGVENFL